MADPYRPQLSQQTTPQAAASAEDFGAAVGRGLEEAGTTIDRAIHQKRERDRDLEAADAGVELAAASTDLDKLAIDARANAAPGGEGHTDAIAKAIEERQNAALQKIRDPNIRAAFKQRWAQLRDNLETREYGWQAGARVDKLAADVDATGTTLANGMATNPNGAGLELSLSTIETTIRAMSIPEDLKAKLIKEQQRKIAAAYGNAIVDSNPKLLTGDEATKTPGLLTEGTLNKYLEPEDIDRLRNGAHIEIRRQETEARQRQTQAEAAAREQIQLLKNRVGDGYVPSDAELDAAAAAAKQYNIPGLEWDVGVMRTERDINKETQTWTPETWKANINALEAKGDKRSQAENVRLKMLQSKAPGAISRFNSDPYAAAAAAENPAPAVDWSEADPAKLSAQLQARASWARAYRSSTGLTFTPYLNNDELNQLRERAKQGPAGKLAIVGQLRSAFGPNPASEILRQIDPNDKDMQVMVGLHPRMAQLYTRGADALKRNGKLAGADAEDGAAMQQIFAEFAPAIPVDLRTAVWNAARNMMAGRADETGHSELTGSELEGAFRQFVHYAGGRLGGDATSKGGFVKWYGQLAWLPQSMSERDFQVHMSRAGKADWLRAGNGEPYFMGSDGKLAKMNDAQIANLARYRLETVNPGVYRLVGEDGGHVVTKDGQPWQFDVTRLR